MRTVVNKLIQLVVVLFFVTFFSFSLLKLIPGDPGSTLKPFATPEQAKGIRTELGLDKPFFSQYFNWLKAFVKRSSAWGSIPSCSMLIIALEESRMRITTFSPYCAGSVATRRSIALPSTTVDTRPSCGTRRSAMSRSERILMREVTAGITESGTIAASWRTPSMR